jgi:hypothetical protein
MPAGFVDVLTQCVPGYTASGNVSLSCDAGHWTVQDNGLRCTDTAMAELIAQLQSHVDLPQGVAPPAAQFTPSQSRPLFFFFFGLFFI